MYMIYRVIKDDRISLSPGDPESQAQDHGGYEGAGGGVILSSDSRRRPGEWLRSKLPYM